MHEVDELTNIVSDVIEDPGLPRSDDHPCPKCKHREAVFFQVRTRPHLKGQHTYLTRFYFHLEITYVVGPISFFDNRMLTISLGTKGAWRVGSKVLNQYLGAVEGVRCAREARSVRRSELRSLKKPFSRLCGIRRNFR